MKLTREYVEKLWSDPEFTDRQVNLVVASVDWFEERLQSGRPFTAAEKKLAQSVSSLMENILTMVNAS